MKVGRGAPAEVKGRHREATDCNKVARSLMKKYGYEMVRYVTGRLLNDEREKRALNKQIMDAKKELVKLEREHKKGKR